MLVDFFVLAFATPFIAIVVWGYGLIAAAIIANLRLRFAQRSLPVLRDAPPLAPIEVARRASFPRGRVVKSPRVDLHVPRTARKREVLGKEQR